MSLAPDTPPRSSRPRAAGLVWLTVALAGCASGEARPPVPAGSQVEELVVRRGTLQPRLILTGELQAVKVSPILVPRTPILQLPIRWMERSGAAVREGQKVLELDSTQFREGVEEARLAESRASNELLQKEARVALELAELEFEIRRARIRLERAQTEASVPADLRSRREYRDQQLELARAEFGLGKAEEDLSARREASKLELEVARLKLQDARYELRTAEEAIDALTLRAPRDGILIVGEHPFDGRRFQLGDSVWVGLEVMNIPTLTEMKVIASLSDVDDGKIAEGARANCTLDAYPDLVFGGHVARIAPVAKEQRQGLTRRAFRVEISLDHSDPERMRPGMSVRAEVLPSPSEAVLIAPRAALDLSTDPPRARLADGGTADVRLGPCSAVECVVEEGLSEGTALGRAG